MDRIKRNKGTEGIKPVKITATNGQHGTAAGTFTLTNGYAPPAVVTALANHSANLGAGWITVVSAGWIREWRE